MKRSCQEPAALKFLSSWKVLCLLSTLVNATRALGLAHAGILEETSAGPRAGLIPLQHVLLASPTSRAALIDTELKELILQLVVLLLYLFQNVDFAGKDNACLAQGLAQHRTHIKYMPHI